MLQNQGLINQPKLDLFHIQDPPSLTYTDQELTIYTQGIFVIQ